MTSATLALKAAWRRGLLGLGAVALLGGGAFRSPSTIETPTLRSHAAVPAPEASAPARCSNPASYGPPEPPVILQSVRIQDGRLCVNGERVFLKTAVHLSNYATTDFASDPWLLRLLRSRKYSNLKANLYWDQFDRDGDGRPDASTKPLNALLNTAARLGLYVSLSFATYSVGGPGVPDGFFATHPDAQAMNERGRRATDTEWRSGRKIPSIFHPAYLEASRRFIREVLAAVDTSKVLYYETTVEPQYIGDQTLDYSPAARAAFARWCARRECPAWPPPVDDPVWHEFRALALAEWVNGDIRAIRDGAGKDVLVAVDYLETGREGWPMRNRNGDSRVFLGALEGVDILQVNWHWHPPSHAPVDVGYDNARALQSAKGWAISEHQTIAGEWFTRADVEPALAHSLAAGNRFGWEIVDVAAASRLAMPVYNDDWTPKEMIAPLDHAHDAWLAMAYAAE